MDLPAAVVWPSSVTELQAIVMCARQSGLRLMPYGAGSSVVGGAMASPHQVVVDLKRLSRVLSIDAGACTATAQVGIMGELFERQLARQGFTQGHFPSSIYCSTLGGWIAARGAGQMSSRYGKIEDQVVGGEVVLGDGSIVRQAVSPLQTDLFNALIGSEGTLGFWSEASVRIHPQPQKRIFRAFDFPDLAGGVQAARQWLLAGLVPSVIRLYDPLDSFLHRGAHGTHARRDRGPDIAAALGAYVPRLVRFFGDKLAGPCRCIVGLEGTRAAVDMELQTLLEIAASAGAIDRGEGPGLSWYQKRYAVSYRMSNAFRAGAAVDTMEVGCPWERLFDVYHAVRRAGLSVGAQVLAHISHLYLEGGSMYFTFVLPAALGEVAYDRMWDRCLSAAVEAGANVSHHHGIGRLKSNILAATMGSAAKDALTAMRRRCDPDSILAPSNLSVASPYVLKEPPVDARLGTGAESRQVPVAPTETMAELEARLNARQGASLGAAAQLFASKTVLEVARSGWLWRLNPQFYTLEPMVAGVDAGVRAGVDTRAHRFIPGPRAAQGPELVEQLLQNDVQRLWLRCSTVTQRRLRYQGEVMRCLELAATIASHPDGRMVQLSVGAGPDGGALDMTLPADEGRQGLALALLRAAAGASAHCALHNAPAVLLPLLGQPLFFAGAWRAVATFARTLLSEGLAFTVPWVDPVGAAGFVDGAQLTDETRSRLEVLARQLFAARELTTTPPPKAVADTGSPDAVVPSAPALPVTLPARLQLRASRAALDNCTYCPKLCRFSCPVAVSSGSETLTPRQLMLTANLDKTGRRKLTDDVAQKLWSCVDCRGCRSFCDHDNDVATVLQDARAELVSASAAPALVQAFIKDFMARGCPPDVAGLHLDGTAVGEVATGLFLGCQNTGDMMPAVTNALTLTQQRYGATRLWSGGERCCGQPLWRWGARQAFADHARQVAAGFGASVQRLVVDDPGCAYTFKHLYAEVGVTVPDVHTVHTLLAGASWDHLTGQWAPQDACYSSRWLGEPGLRQSIARPEALARGSVLESAAGCCGGMLLPFYDAALADTVGRDFARDLLGGGGTRILASSPTCSRRLRAAGAPVDDWLALWRPAGM